MKYAVVNSNTEKVKKCHCFLHDVVDASGETPVTSQKQRDKLWSKYGILVVDTYVAAALRIHELGFLSDEQLHFVSSCALAQFARMQPGSFASPNVYERRKAEYIRDISKVNAVLLDKSGSGSEGEPKDLLIPIDRYLR